MWYPSSNMYFFEVAAICGVSVKQLKTCIIDLSAKGAILPEWHQKHIIKHPAVSVIIEHYKIDCSIEERIITILTIAREKNFNKRKKRYYNQKNKPTL